MMTVSDHHSRPDDSPMPNPAGARDAAEARRAHDLCGRTGAHCLCDFVLITSVLVFLFGLSVQDQQPVEGAVIKLLSLIPFLGGAWHIHRAQKALREYARALENDDVAR